MATVLVPIALEESTALSKKAAEQAVDEVRRAIGEFRVIRGWNQKELARRAGVREGTISKLKDRKRGVRLSTLFQIAHALQVPVAVLVTSPPIHLPLRETKAEDDPKDVAR